MWRECDENVGVNGIAGNTGEHHGTYVGVSKPGGLGLHHAGGNGRNAAVGASNGRCDYRRTGNNQHDGHVGNGGRHGYRAIAQCVWSVRNTGIISRLTHMYG